MCNRVLDNDKGGIEIASSFRKFEEICRCLKNTYILLSQHRFLLFEFIFCKNTIFTTQAGFLCSLLNRLPPSCPTNVICGKLRFDR